MLCDVLGNSLVVLAVNVKGSIDMRVLSKSYLKQVVGQKSSVRIQTLKIGYLIL